MFVLGWTGYGRTLPDRIEGALPGEIPVPYVRLTPQGPSAPDPAGTVLLVHGLDSNKGFMQLLAMALTDGGFETWIIDLPGHGDSQGAFGSEASVRAIGRTLDSLPDETVVIGHSLGAALAADLAIRRPIPAAILLSPPPIPLAPLRIGRVLVVTGRFDAPRINASIPALLDMAGQNADWRRMRWGAHSTPLYNPGQHRLIVDWAGGKAGSVRTPERLIWLGLMLASALVIPALAIRLEQKGCARAAGTASQVPAAEDIVARIGALAASLALLALFNPLSWLRLFRTDYLIGVLLISGLVLWRGRGFGMSLRGLLHALGAAAWLILALGVVGSSFLDLVPSGEQWLRFPLLAAACLPLAMYDESVVRKYRPGWRMWGMFLLSRVLIWAAVVTGVLLMNTEAVFLVVIMHFIVLGWALLWWTGGLLYRATGEPAAAALFSSLVQGWVFAALFVTI